MNDTHLKLISLTEELRLEFLALAEDYSAAGEDRYRSAADDFPAYVRSLREGESGLGLPGGRVPYSTFWLSAGRRLLGRATLRHRLTPELEQEGGHIGYDIRPSERRKGYGTAILRLTLGKAREMGLRRVMLSCDTDNVGSAKIIERNGGRLASRATSGRSGKQISRYWIELSRAVESAAPQTASLDRLDFAPLAERPDAVPQVARWWCDEWGLPRRHESLEAYVGELASLKPGDFPFHLLALSGGQLLGVATLKDRSDLDELFPDSRHWLSGVYVPPALRGRGVATALCLELIEIARARGIGRLHLTTEALDGGLYAKIGWQPVRQIRVGGVDLLVMARDVL